jgi:integrase
MPIRFDTRNQRWRFEFNQVIAGQRQRASRLLPKGYTKAEAQRFDLEETKRLHSIATGVSKPEPLIEDAVLLYLKHHAPALKSYENIVRELKSCFEAYAGKPFSALPAIALAYKPVDENKMPLAAATVRNRLSYIRAACRYAWKHHGLGDSNPAERISMPKVRNERHVYLGREEFLKICRKIKPGGSRAAIRIAFYSGMRAGEVGSATVAPGGEVFELAAKDTKNGMPRAVPIHPRIAHVIRNPMLWPVRPTKWTVSKEFKAGARSAGYGHARLHDLRHSTASEMINAGVDLYTVGGVLGHKSAVSTKRYSHLATQTLQDAVSLVGKNLRTTGKAKAA